MQQQVSTPGGPLLPVGGQGYGGSPLQSPGSMWNTSVVYSSTGPVGAASPQATNQPQHYAHNHDQSTNSSPNAMSPWGQPPVQQPQPGMGTLRGSGPIYGDGGPLQVASVQAPIQGVAWDLSPVKHSGECGFAQLGSCHLESSPLHVLQTVRSMMCGLRGHC